MKIRKNKKQIRLISYIVNRKSDLRELLKDWTNYKLMGDAIVKLFTKQLIEVSPSGMPMILLTDKGKAMMLKINWRKYEHAITYEDWKFNDEFCKPKI